MPSSNEIITSIADVFESQLEDDGYYIQDGNIFIYYPDGDEMVIYTTDTN
jgi:hypothetical protein